MAVTASNTPFPLGAYLGNPDNSSAANEATYEAHYTSFSQLMGAAPQYLTTFVDQNQAISQWVGNSQWAASSAAASADARSQTPVIALPLNSNAPGSATPDQQFQAFASGQYDNVIQGIVKAWAQAGFSNQVFRPGWEMNLQGPNYAGDSAESQADWVKAFQHVSTVLHQAAAANGVNVQVVWNPNATNYSNAEATANLYPGDKYVDVIGADMYSDMYPFSDGTNPATYHDWHTGASDTSVAQFIADPVNRAHYWSNPAATVWSSDSSNGHSQSLTSLIQFAEQHGKPFAVPETGAGNSNGGTDVSDDAAFPQWLAQQLTAAQAAGEKIAFVNLWDSNGGGNYEFSHASDGKPTEAAAWAKYFGAQQTVGAASPPATVTPVTPVTPVATTPATLSVGSGPNTLALQVSEDAWQGDAQFTVSVDGTQIGGTQTATASHGAGQTQTVNVLGSFGTGLHTATINFLNDAWGGTAATDRNLYVNSATLNAGTVSNAGLTLLSSGPQSFSFNGIASATVASPATDTLDLHVSEDAWQGDAQYVVKVDGNQVGGVRAATALHSQGATQDVSIAGNWGAGPHAVSVSFINDAYGGTAATDRNLYVDAVTYNGAAASGAPATMLSNGTANFGVGVPVTATPLTLHLAEDAWQGNAQYAVAIDGTTVLQGGTVTALNASGQSQAVNVSALLSAGKHDVAVSFLNDAWGGTASTDRNLYVKGIDVSGSPVSGASAALLSTGTTHFQIVVPSA
ncbi:MAG TPA: carbohydrate-binding domain-containing protein [Acetobacteraceae bacterium]